MSEQTSQQAATDTAAASSKLETWLRFADLKAANIVRSWSGLRDLIDKAGFPAGRVLGLNNRSWTMTEIQTWLASRPTVSATQRRKVKKRQRRKTSTRKSK
jgi:hypothetical protein